MTVRYGVTIEFDVDDQAAGGPSKAEIRRFMRMAMLNQQEIDRVSDARFRSLSDVGIKYLHEASSNSPRKKP